MVAIIKELPITADIQQVWDALTQPEEIACWWTDDLSFTPEVGTLAEFRFSKRTFVIQFEITELADGLKMSWITIQGPSTGHWAGTNVTWQLEPVAGGTKLLFTHDKFIEQDYRYDLTSAWWEKFLNSLKSYLETGQGTPGSVPLRVKQAGTTTAAIIEERIIAADPQMVWSALTQPAEIVGWWAEEVGGTLQVGSLGEFHFRPPAGTLQFEIAALDQNEKAHWLSRKSPPQWAGTSVTWQLEPVQGGTKVVFTHDGFAPLDPSYEPTRANWRYFLDSLKSYLETGKGTPGMPLNIRASVK